MVTSAFLYHVMHFLNVTIDIRNVCVFLAPLFSSLTTLVTYNLARELKDTGAGLVAAAMIAIVPGYISRSVAGSYDNEGIAIFCMLFTYFLWIKSVKTGSVFWSTLCALAYFYMVSLHQVHGYQGNDCVVCSGVFMGWVCVSDKPDSHACACTDGDRAILSSYLCGILHGKHTHTHVDVYTTSHT